MTATSPWSNVGARIGARRGRLAPAGCRWLSATSWRRSCRAQPLSRSVHQKSTQKVHRRRFPRLIRFRLRFNRQDFSDAGAGAPFIWEELLCVDGRPAKLTIGAAMAASASRALRLADELGRRPTDDELIVVVRPCFVGREDFVEAGLGVADFELRRRTSMTRS